MQNSNCLSYAVSSTKNNRQMRQGMLTAQQKSHGNMQAMSGEILPPFCVFRDCIFLV